jgi:heme/copper-type cytochrome/quinol oxidase subunit 4
MEEQKKPEVKVEPTDIKKPDYYQRKGQKVFDFFVGFLGSLILCVVYLIIITNYSASLGSIIAFVFNIPVIILILVLACFFSFSSGRRFIGIGVISIAIIPLIAFGSCLMLLR